MADKLKQGISVLTTFVGGETPTSAKLSSITAQLRNAASQLEKAVGDVHDQSWPYSTATTARLSPAWGRLTEATVVSGSATLALDIANIARLIGPSSSLNPEAVGGSRSVTENVPAGVHEFSTKLPPESTSITFSDATVFGAQQTTAFGLNAAGDYMVSADGKIYTSSATHATAPGTLTYTIDPDSWFGGPNYLGARFNVLPGPNQMTSGSAGCTVGALNASGQRPITAPTITHAQYNDDLTTSTLSAIDANFGQQLKLPLILTENYSVGEVIPGGFILLKNWTTGEVYEGAEYVYNGETSVLCSADITAALAAGNTFVLVTVGTDITTSVDDLRRKMGHTHSRAFGEPFVDVSGISGWTAGPWGPFGSFTASAIPGNYAPQYLHRYGYQVSEGAWNDRNAMRGSLVIGEKALSPGDYVSASGLPPTIDTFKVAFGHPDNAYMYLDTSGTYWMKNDLAGDSIQIESAGGLTLVAGTSTLALISSSLASFSFVDQLWVATSSNLNLNLEHSDPGSAPSYTLRVANNGNGGTDGWARIASLGLSYVFGDETTTAALSPSQDTDRQVYMVTNSSSSETSMLFSETNPGAEGNLELRRSTAPVDAYYYLKFTGSSTVYGSIRGTDDAADEVFYSWISGSFDYCGQSGFHGALPTIPAVTAQDAGHVKFVSGGADYGEWMQAGDAAEWDPYFKKIKRKDNHMGLPEGLVVYVHAGRFWAQPLPDLRSTPMVITNRAIVVGNQKDGALPAEECEILSFIGQVPVMCHGLCKDGDYLIPNPDEPQSVIAISPHAISFLEYQQAIGRAWSSSDNEGLKKVMCAVGKK